VETLLTSVEQADDTIIYISIRQVALLAWFRFVISWQKPVSLADHNLISRENKLNTSSQRTYCRIVCLRLSPSCLCKYFWYQHNFALHKSNTRCMCGGKFPVPDHGSSVMAGLHGWWSRLCSFSIRLTVCSSSLLATSIVIFKSLSSFTLDTN